MAQLSRMIFWVAVATGTLLLGACERAVPVDPDFRPTGEISGVVTLVGEDSDHSLVDVAAADVDDPERIIATVTSSDGSYLLEQVPPGIYNITAGKSGYYTMRRDGVEVLAGQRTTGIDFLLPSQEEAGMVYVSGGSNDGDPDQTGAVGQELAEPFVVEVQDNEGSPVRNVVVTFDVLDAQDGGRMLTSSALTTDENGRVSNTYVLGQTTGQNRIRALVVTMGGEEVVFTPVGVPDVPASIEVVGGGDQSGVVAQTLLEPIVLEVSDQFGNLVEGATVDFLPEQDDAVVDPVAGVTDAGGRVETSWTLGSTAMLDPPQKLVVSSGQATLDVFAQADHDVPVEISAHGGNHQSAVAGTSLPAPLTARVSNQYGNPVDYQPVLFHVVSGEADLAAAGTVRTSPEGLASTGVTLGGAIGPVVITASTGQLPDAVFDLSSIAGPPWMIYGISGFDQWGHIGQPMAEPIVVQVVDQFDNPLPGVWVRFIPDNFLAALAGTVDPEVDLTDGQGLASTILTPSSKAGAGEDDGQLFEFVVEGYPDTETGGWLNVYPDPPAVIYVWSGDNQNGPFGSQLPQPLEIHVVDQYENSVFDQQVTWGVPAGGAIEPNPSVTDEMGFSLGEAWLGSDPGTPNQVFTAQAGDASAQFHATAVGHSIDRLDPAFLWAGYPDPEHPDPASILVPLSIHGGGFADGSLVVWDVGTASEELLTPTDVQTNLIQVEVSADHFAEDMLGAHLVTVRDPQAGDCNQVAFMVGSMNMDSGQGPALCADYVAASWDYVDCSTLQAGEANYGQDGHYDSAYFPDNQEDQGDGTVADALTGLVWHQCPAGQSGPSCSGLGSTLTWQQAVDHCAGSDLAGHEDWRLPQAQELMLLVHFGLKWPAIDPTAFPGTPEGYFWSADVHADNPQRAWRVDFDVGFVEDVEQVNNETYVRCVRGDPVDPVGRYVRSEPEQDEPVVVDQVSGITWQGCPAGQSHLDCLTGTQDLLDWPAALAYCEQLNWGGHQDWRLPQMKELFSMIDFGAYWPAVDPQAFPGTTPSWTWTSTNSQSLAVFTWRVAMGDGYVTGMSKSSTSAVRCVRGGGF